MEGGDSARHGPATAAPGRALATVRKQHGEIRDLAAQVDVSCGAGRRGRTPRPAGLPAASQAVMAARGAAERRIDEMLAECGR
jgi:hypothetical protein